MSRNSSGRAYHRLNRNLIAAHMLITTLTQPLAACFANRPLRKVAVPFTISMAIVLIICLAHPLGVARFRRALLSVGLVYVLAMLSYLNGGAFGAPVEPMLLCFGIASLVALDGAVASLVLGLAGGWGLALAGAFIFAVSHGKDWVRLVACMTWWLLTVVSGYLLGRGINRILKDLEVSREALEAAQDNERQTQRGNEAIRQSAAGERAATLAHIGEASDSWMQGAVQAVIATSGQVCEAAASTQRSAAAAEQASAAVAQLAEEASRNTEIVAAARLSASIGHARRQIAETASATAAAVDRTRGKRRRAGRPEPQRPAHRRGGGADRQHRRSNQAAGAERDDRGGAAHRAHGANGAGHAGRRGGVERGRDGAGGNRQAVRRTVAGGLMVTPQDERSIRARCCCARWLKAASANKCISTPTKLPLETKA